jgi:pyrroline-5-carboxylate reductase
MMEGAVSLGFSFADAKELVMRAFDSSLALLRFSHKHPAELKMDIASPGGTTIAGLGAMEEMGVRAALIHTLRACYERSKEMSRQSPL